MDGLTEITWTQTGGVERIVLRRQDDSGAIWSVIWTGGMMPTHWRQQEDDPEPEPIGRQDLPAAVRSAFTVALDDLARRLQMTRGIL